MKNKILILFLFISILLPNAYVLANNENNSTKVNEINNSTKVEDKYPQLYIKQNHYTHPTEIYPFNSVSHVFTVQNNGTADLIITDVRSSCNCTITQFTKIIPPGGTGEVHMVVKTDLSWQGQEFQRSSVILSNDPKTTTNVITISGNVQMRK